MYFQKKSNGNPLDFAQNLMILLDFEQKSKGNPLDFCPKYMDSDGFLAKI